MSRKKKILALLFLIVIVGGGVGLSLLFGEKPSQGVAVDITTAQLSDFTISVTGSGLVEGIENKEVRARVGGRVAELLVEEGDYIGLGQTIAVLDERDLQAQLQTAIASLASTQAEVNQLRNEIDWVSVDDSIQVQQAKSQLAAAEARLKEVKQGATAAQIAQAENSVLESRLALQQAEEQKDKMERLFNQQAVSKQQLLDAEHNYTLAKQRYESASIQLELLQAGPTEEQLAVAKSQVNDGQLAVISAQRQAQWKLDSLGVAQERLLQAQQNVALIEEQLAETAILSSYQGNITRLLVGTGAYISAGTPVLEVADLSRLVVKARIDEVDVTSVFPSQAVKVTSDAFIGKQLEGVVTRIAPQPIYEGKVAKYNVTIEILNPPEGLRPGMNTDVEIITLQRESLTVPIQAVVSASDVVPVSTAASKAVFVVRDGRAVKVPVTTGETSLTTVEILQGLNPGDLIITGNYYTLQNLEDGDLVKYPELAGDDL